MLRALLRLFNFEDAAQPRLGLGEGAPEGEDLGEPQEVWPFWDGWRPRGCGKKVKNFNSVGDNLLEMVVFCLLT